MLSAVSATMQALIEHLRLVYSAKHLQESALPEQISLKERVTFDWTEFTTKIPDSLKGSPQWADDVQQLSKLRQQYSLIVAKLVALASPPYVDQSVPQERLWEWRRQLNLTARALVSTVLNWGIQRATGRIGQRHVWNAAGELCLHEDLLDLTAVMLEFEELLLRGAAENLSRFRPLFKYYNGPEFNLVVPSWSDFPESDWEASEDGVLKLKLRVEGAMCYSSNGRGPVGIAYSTAGDIALGVLAVDLPVVTGRLVEDTSENSEKSV